MDIKDNEQIISEIAKAWETMNAELIIANLDKTFVYDSQWVFESLDYCKYIEYIRAKFKTIKEKGTLPIVKIVPDNSLGGSMVALKQGNNPPAFYRVKINNGKVVKGDLCMF